MELREHSPAHGGGLQLATPVGLSTTSREAFVKPSFVTGSMYSCGAPSGTGVNLTAMRSCSQEEEPGWLMVGGREAPA